MPDLTPSFVQLDSWGFGISFSVILVHLENHQPWSSASLASLSSIGTIQLGLMFFLTFGVNNAFRRYPDKAKPSLYIAGVVYSLSMLLSSFANKVWQLILTQGVLCGVSGAVLYGPCLLWTMSWFVEKRGLASGLIFSGTGLGGAAFPFVLGKLLDSYGTLLCLSSSIRLTHHELLVIRRLRLDVSNLGNHLCSLVRTFDVLHPTSDSSSEIDRKSVV